MNRLVFTKNQFRKYIIALSSTKNLSWLDKLAIRRNVIIDKYLSKDIEIKYDGLIINNELAVFKEMRKPTQ